MRRVGIALLISAVCGLITAAPAQAQSDDNAGVRKELIKRLDAKLRKLRSEMIREIDRRLGATAKPDRPTKTHPRSDKQGFLGIALRPLKPGMRALLGIPKGQGVMVDEVVPQSAAAAAGLRRTDVILAWNGKKLGGEEDLAKHARAGRAGDVASLTIIREGKKMQVKATLLARGEKATSSRKGDKGEGDLERFLDKALKGGKKGEPKGGDNPFGMDPDGMKKMMEQFGANPEQMQEMMKRVQEMMKDPEARKRMEDMMRRMMGGQDAPPSQPDTPKKPDTPRKGDKKIHKMLDDLLGKKGGDSKKAPVKTAKKGGKAYLGVTLQPVTETMREQLKLAEGEGIMISSVVKDSPAARSGLQQYDVLVKWGKHKIGNTSDVRKAISANAAGDAVKMVVVRKGERQTVKVTLGSPQPSEFK